METTSSVIVFDFETTGGSPATGDRPIEVGAVRIENDMITNRFQSLMNPGFSISWLIESITGIDNALVADAPPCEEVMEAFADFIGSTPLVAHNASFDLSFLDNELNYISRFRENKTACSMLISRRLFQDAPNHKLRTMVEYCGLPSDDLFHRALADAEKTGQLWIAMTDMLKGDYHINDIPFSLMQDLAKVPKKKVDSFLKKKTETLRVNSLFTADMIESGNSNGEKT